jgi:hypothetical protein
MSIATGLYNNMLCMVNNVVLKTILRVEFHNISKHV